MSVFPGEEAASESGLAHHRSLSRGSPWPGCARGQPSGSCPRVLGKTRGLGLGGFGEEVDCQGEPQIIGTTWVAGTGGASEAEGMACPKTKRGSAWQGPEPGAGKQDGQGSWGPENAWKGHWQLPEAASPPGRSCPANPCMCLVIARGHSPGPESCHVSSLRAAGQDPDPRQRDVHGGPGQHRLPSV